MANICLQMFPHWHTPPLFYFLIEVEKIKAVLESHQPFEVAAAPTSGQANLVSSSQSRFTSTRNAELAKPRVRGYCSLVLKLYPSNMQRMLSKDLTRFDADRVFSSTPKSNKRKKASG